MKAITKTVNIHEAKTHFSKLLAAVAKGQRITICKDGTPVAQLGPLNQPIPVLRPGLLKGRVTMADAFDAPLPPETVPRSRVGQESPVRYPCLLVVCDSVSTTLETHLSPDRDYTGGLCQCRLTLGGSYRDSIEEALCGSRRTRRQDHGQWF